MIEKSVDYLKESAGTFAALTDDGFVQASRSFIQLFKIGWPDRQKKLDFYCFFNR